MRSSCLLVLITLGCSGPPASGLDAAVVDAAAADASRAVDAASEIDAAPPPDATPPDAGRTCLGAEGPEILAALGERADGASLRIEGCRFGPKAEAAPRLYDRVDDQPAYAGLSVGDRIPTDGDAPWTVNHDNWSEFVRYATDRPRPGRAAFYRVSGGSNGGDGALGWPRALGGTSPPPEQRLLYVSWWYRPSMDPGGGSPTSGSNKFIRVWDDPEFGGTKVSWTQMHLTYRSGAEHTAWRSWSRDGRVGEWNRMEITIDADGGTVRHYVNNVQQRVSNSTRGDFDIDDFEKHPDWAHLGLSVAVLGFDHGDNSYGEMVTDFGEIYIDTTRARVEIGDAPTWGESRHRELQLPTEWSDDAIVVQVGRGAFEALAGQYLYVVDAEGRVNEDGFAL